MPFARTSWGKQGVDNVVVVNSGGRLSGTLTRGAEYNISDLCHATDRWDRMGLYQGMINRYCIKRAVSPSDLSSTVG